MLHLCVGGSAEKYSRYIFWVGLLVHHDNTNAMMHNDEGRTQRKRDCVEKIPKRCNFRLHFTNFFDPLNWTVQRKQWSGNGSDPRLPPPVPHLGISPHKPVFSECVPNMDVGDDDGNHALSELWVWSAVLQGGGKKILCRFPSLQLLSLPVRGREGGRGLGMCWESSCCFQPKKLGVWRW